MSTPSPSPISSPAKRPSLGRRPSSGNSLSPSTKPATHKSQRHYAVGAKRLHTRNASHARALGKAGKLNSAQSLIEAGVEHHRQNSSTSIPSTSLKNPAVKRNNSHAVLAKNSSHVNLRKNKSANALVRNISHTQLHRRTGLAPLTLKSRKESSRKDKGFELGEKSTDEEVEGDFEEDEEWEDSATQSPKLTRSNSNTVICQPSPPTTSRNAVAEKPPKAFQHHNTSSPKEPPLRHNRSAPNFGAQPSSASPVHPPDPPANLILLQHNPRSSRAPPAVSSISAGARDPLPCNNSSFTHINHADTISSHNTSQNALNTDSTFRNTPNTGKSAGGSSSADGGVSHFLSTKTTPIPNHARRTSSGSDYESPSSFLPHYHPQKSTSPEKVRMKDRFPQPSKSATTATQHRSSSHLPSRTQQRLELQRRETMRAAAPTTPSTPLLIADGHRGSPSAVSLHSRSGSQGRSRGPTVPASAGAARLMIKQDYEAAERQLAVVRRFRNPVVEALGRLKEAGVLNLEKGPPKSGRSNRDGRRDRDKQKKVDARMEPGRSSNRNLKSDPNSKDGGQGTTKTGSSFEDSDAQQRPSSSPRHSRSPTRGRLTRSAHGPSTGRKPHPRRQGSHDDIGLSRSQGSYEAPDGEGDERDRYERGVGGESRVSAEEEMMRRMWESSEVYDKGDEG